MIWVKTYVFSTFNKKEDFSRLNVFPERYLVAVEPPDYNFTMCK